MPRDRTPYMAPRFIYGSHAKDHLTGWALLIHTISVRDSAQLVHVRASVCMLVYSSCKELCAFIVQLHIHISSIWLLEVMKQSLDYRNISLLHRKSAQGSIRIFAMPSEIRSHNLQPYAYHRTSTLTTELSRHLSRHIYIYKCNSINVNITNVNSIIIDVNANMKSIS